MILEFFILLLVICSTLLVVAWLVWKANGEGFVDRPIIEEFKAFYDYIGPPSIEWLGVVLVIFILYLGSFNDGRCGGGEGSGCGGGCGGGE